MAIKSPKPAANKQLPSAHATALSQTSLFLDKIDFPANFEHQISLINQSSKTGDQKIKYF